MNNKKSCKDCLYCQYFQKDAHGKGKHEVACYFTGAFGNILYGNQIKVCDLYCDDIYELFNSISQKDKRILELEEKLKQAYKDNQLLDEAKYTAQQDDLEYFVKKEQSKLAIEKLEEVLKWVDKETDGNMIYSASILIERLNSMIAELKGAKQ